MTTRKDPEGDWLTITAAAEVLDIHPRTLRRYIRQGLLPKVGLANQVVRIRPKDLEQFREEYVRIQTGTGGCYVRRVVPITREKRPRPAEARPARLTKIDNIR